MSGSGETDKRNRILTAALGFVATIGACGAFGTFATFENRALFGAETSTGARPIVAEPKDGAYKSPTGRKAFLVAADDYGDAANPLPCAKNDVNALKTRLEALGFETTVLRTGAGPSTAPTKGIIEREFGKFAERLRPGDFALVYLSGHGLKPLDSDESFFAPVDVDVENLFETSVSINVMLDALKASDATFRWVIVDACREDPLNPGDKESTPFKGASKSIGSTALGDIKKAPDAVALLQSCQPGKRSYEGGHPGAEDIENGFFTLSLLEALDENDSKADANRDGVLTFYETFDYVSLRTDELARKSYGVSQKPNLTGSITNFALLDGLTIEGIPVSKWNEARALYQEGCVLRAQKEWRDALAKIQAARQINVVNEAYKSAEAEVEELLRFQTETENAKRWAEEEKRGAPSEAREENVVSDDATQRTTVDDEKEERTPDWRDALWSSLVFIGLTLFFIARIFDFGKLTVGAKRKLGLGILGVLCLAGALGKLDMCFYLTVCVWTWTVGCKLVRWALENA